jgi:hypothetical protein
MNECMQVEQKEGGKNPGVFFLRMNVQSRSEKCVLGEMQLYSPATDLDQIHGLAFDPVQKSEQANLCQKK